MPPTTAARQANGQSLLPYLSSIAAATLLPLLATHAMVLGKESSAPKSHEVGVLAGHLPLSNSGRFAKTSSQFVPAWAAQAIFYQIFPERFENGDPSNDPVRESLENPSRVPSNWKPTPWTQDWYKPDSWQASRPNRFFQRGIYHRRYGGDIQGIINRLDYLRDLGVNTLYLNPIFYARSSHKYDGTIFHHIDPYFGPDPAGDLANIAHETLDLKSWQMTAADRLFLKLIDEVHRRGMRIIIDGVFNHTGRDFPAFRDILERQADSPYKDWFVISSFDDPETPANEFRYRGWYGHASLPEFADNAAGDDLNEEPKQYVYEISRRWMDPNGDGDPSDGIDGWRLDVAQDVPVKFWNEWNIYVRTINPEAYTVAEVWDDSSSLLEEGNFSAAMNYYGFAFPVKGYLVDGQLPASDFARALDSRRERHTRPHAYALQNLIDSHDTPRVASLIVNPARQNYANPERCDYDVNEYYSPWRSRTFRVTKPTDEDRQIQRMEALFQMAYVGPPMIYYGTEAGMWGGDDPCCRMPMVWPEMTYEPQAGHPRGEEREPDPVEFDRALYDYYRMACTLRSQHAALQRGEVEVLQTDDDAQFFAMRRWDDLQSIYVLLNRGDTPYEWELPEAGDQPVLRIFSASKGNEKIEIPATDGTVHVSVPGCEGIVLLQENQANSPE